jgi:hypothetical protein
MSELFVKTLNPTGYGWNDKYSYSKISTYEKCGFKFKLQYVDKLKAKGNLIAADFGTAIHHAEEAIAEAIKTGQAINYAAVKNNFILENIKIEYEYPTDYNTPDTKSEVPRTYKEKRNEYLEQAVYRLEKFMSKNPNYKIIGIEQAFDFSYDENHSFNGKIDRVLLDEAAGKLVIQDIKSWPYVKSISELKTDLLQFAIYMMACELIYGIDRKNMICEYDLPLCDTILRIDSSSLIEEYEPMIKDLFDGIANKDYKPAPSALCYWCQYNALGNPNVLKENPKAVCPYASTWQKKGDQIWKTLTKYQGPEMEACDRQMILEQFKQLMK